MTDCLAIDLSINACTVGASGGSPPVLLMRVGLVAFAGAGAGGGDGELDGCGAVGLCGGERGGERGGGRDGFVAGEALACCRSVGSGISPGLPVPNVSLMSWAPTCRAHGFVAGSTLGSVIPSP